MNKYLVQISPDPFDVIIVEEDKLESAKRGAYYVGLQQPQLQPNECKNPNAAVISKDDSQGYGCCYQCGHGSYSHECDNCGAYIN